MLQLWLSRTRRVRCSDPVDRQLVALSRQLFEFYKGGNGIEFSRIHELGEWKRQRLGWLEGFEPGLVQGPLLREALGLEGDDTGKYVEWLANIAVWGYPRGWVGSTDPRLRVWEVIQERTGEGPGVEDQSQSSLLIHGEQGNPEEVILSHVSTQSLGSSSNTSNDSPAPRRWAQYPDTYFSSSLLPIYNGMTLPPIGSSTLDPISTFSCERAALWNGIVRSNSSSSPPPPPPTSPPPLPPAPAPPHLSRPYVPSSMASDDDSEQDMDLSDSD